METINFLKTIYNFLLPQVLKRKIKVLLAPPELKTLRKKILKYFSELPLGKLTTDDFQAINYLKRNVISVFPYPFQEKYKSKNIRVFKDQSLGLFYVLSNEKRLYFKRGWSEEKIKVNWNMLQIEQDDKSPHKYLTKDFEVKENDIVADVGCAEGNFALNIINEVGKIFLFEGDSEWIECLEATFSPWKHKIFIINKFVSDNDRENNLTLNLYFKDIPLSFLKIDIEGSERQLFRGAEEILDKKSPLKIAVTTYHSQNDASDFSHYLKSKGFEVSFSKGFMLYLFDKDLTAPFFRKGLIRATRSNRFNKISNHLIF